MSEEILVQVVAKVGGTMVKSLEIPLPQPPEEAVRSKVEEKASEEPKKLVVTFLHFLQDNVVSLLKYLYGKRKKYVVSKEVGFYVKLMRNRTRIKRAVVVKRKWEAATAKAIERVVSLSSQCATMKFTLQEQEDHHWAKEVECEVLLLNLAKKKCKAKAVRRTKDRRQIVAMKTEQMELWGTIGARTEVHNKKLQRANELMTSLAEQMNKHKVKLADWAKKFTNCDSGKSSNVKCRVKLEVDCDWLQFD